MSGLGYYATRDRDKSSWGFMNRKSLALRGLHSRGGEGGRGGRSRQRLWLIYPSVGSPSLFAHRFHNAVVGWNAFNSTAGPATAKGADNIDTSMAKKDRRVAQSRCHVFSPSRLVCCPVSYFVTYMKRFCVGQEGAVDRSRDDGTAPRRMFRYGGCSATALSLFFAAWIMWYDNDVYTHWACSNANEARHRRTRQSSFVSISRVGCVRCPGRKQACNMLLMLVWTLGYQQ